MWQKNEKHRKIRPRSSRSRNPLHDISSSSDDSTTRAQASSANNGDQRTCAHYSSNNKTVTQTPGGKYHKYYKNCGNIKKGHKRLRFTDLAGPNLEAEPTRLAPYNRTNLATLTLGAYTCSRISPMLSNGHYVLNSMITQPKILVSLTVKRSPVKRSKMTSNDTTYTVNTVMVPPTPFTNQEQQDPVLDTSGLNSSGTSSTRGNLQSLSVAINVNDDQNNNDVVELMEARTDDIEMGPIDQVHARNQAINDMEAANASLPSLASSSTSSVEILNQSPASRKEAEGMAGASCLARSAASASALAERQRERYHPIAADPQTVPDGEMDMDISVFYDSTTPATNNDEVGSNSFTPNNTPNGNYPHHHSPPWTPNLHPCQPPPFVSYTNCRHDYTRSDERIIYDNSSPDTPSRFTGEWCSPDCHVPGRCLRHFPFTHGCFVCMPSPISSDSDLDYHPNINGTPKFIRVGAD